MLEDRKFSKLIKPKEDDSEQEPDNICDGCDSTGEVNGRVCPSCQGKGYLNP